MLVKLQSLPTYLINLPEDKDRLNQSIATLHQINQQFTIVRGVRHATSVVGCALSHLEILKTYSPKCLVLEDDVQLTSNQINIVEVPDNADALYLGLSDHGHVPNWHLGVKHKAEFQYINDNLVRVNNMCGTHSIVYLTDRYWQVVKTATEHSIKNNLAFDLTFASIHRYFNIYGLKKPMFYQKDQAHNTDFILK
jgi:hypothetical protein